MKKKKEKKFSTKFKKIIEDNPVVLSTVTFGCKPNAIAVAFVKVVDGKILITDNFMKRTVDDLRKNRNVCLLAWNKDWEGVKIVGRAEYHDSGKFKEFVRKIKENKGLPAKGAIVVEIEEVFRLA